VTRRAPRISVVPIMLISMTAVNWAMAGASLKRSVTCAHHVGSLRLPCIARTNRHQNTTQRPASSEQLIVNTQLTQVSDLPCPENIGGAHHAVSRLHLNEVAPQFTNPTHTKQPTTSQQTANNYSPSHDPIAAHKPPHSKAADPHAHYTMHCPSLIPSPSTHPSDCSIHST